jgi:Tol biopolymer transport system component
MSGKTHRYGGRRWFGAAVLALVLIALTIVGSLADGLHADREAIAEAKPQNNARLTRISELPGGGQLNGPSFEPDISADGRYVVYLSNARNLIDSAQAPARSIVVHDRLGGRSDILLTDDADAYQFYTAVISADGRFVAYNRIDVDLTEEANIYLWDLETGTQTLVGEKEADSANDDLFRPAISGDGRTVAFQSEATNLVTDTTDGRSNVFLWDSQTEETTLLSNGIAGSVAPGGENASISDDGQFVLYENTTLEGDNACTAVSLYDRSTGLTRVIADNACDSANYTVGSAALAPSGDYAAYIESCYTCDTYGVQTIRVVGLRGRPGYALSNRRPWPDGIEHPGFMWPSLSADGNFVTFLLGPNSIAPGRIFVYDHAADAVTQVTVNAQGETGDNDSFAPVISATGRFITFASQATNLVPNDTNGAQDVFIYDQRLQTEPTRPLGVLDAGEYHTCALTPQGRAVCWGADDHGQAESRDGPFLQVGAGAIHTCALRPNGTVACWGGNQYGQAEDQAGPFIRLAVGGDSNCGLRPDGRLACWGRDAALAPTGPDDVFTQVSVGVLHACGLTPAGDVVCWGENGYLQAEGRPGPFDQVVTGYFHTCALRPDGEAICWGDDLHGQAQNRPVPYVQLTAGYAHTCGLRPDNRVECWGDNWAGQAADQMGPFSQISSHYAHTCGLTTDGRVLCWGWNEDGQAEDQAGPFGPFRPSIMLPLVAR